ncbi:GAF domain-containing protein [Paenibacillus sp. GYB003]|uniref:GAF domain-containing protein n=1 Tax=Paenibacillus sp. GYB003 TaxID=2994392 RepID=UPI002F96A0D7
MDDQDQEQAERVRDLIGDSRYIPFLDRAEESALSLAVKGLANFIIALVTLLNVPAFVIGLMWFIEQLIQKGINPNFKIEYNYTVIASIFGGWLLICFLYEKTLKNMVSPRVLPIWFVNSKGFLRNRFYSVELASKYSKDLDQLILKQAEEHARLQIQSWELQNIRLQETIERVRALNEFPDEVFESIRRIFGYMSDYVTDPSNTRNQFEVVMDMISVEISNYRVIHPLIKQASIMLLDHKKEFLRIAGKYNMPNHAVKSHIVRLGEKFAGKVTRDGEIVWISDVNSEAAQLSYGFVPNAKREYTSVMGFPIQEMGSEQYEPFGVIVIYFSEKIEFTEEEETAINKILEVYAQVILSFIKLYQFNMTLQGMYGIIEAKNEVLGGGTDHVGDPEETRQG